jgi:hypothetical protein
VGDRNDRCHPPVRPRFCRRPLDQAQEFSEAAWADWRADKAEQFGDQWPEVQAILRELESYGIYMEDVSPGNISFAD